MNATDCKHAVKDIIPSLASNKAPVIDMIPIRVIKDSLASTHFCHKHINTHKPVPFTIGGFILSLVSIPQAYLRRTSDVNGSKGPVII